MIRSPVKWVGSKAGIMAELVRHLPTGQRLVEPFAGSCSVMMNTDYPAYLVADVNHDLINMYRQIREAPYAFIAHAKLLFQKANSSDEYYRRREEFRGDALTQWERAVTFLYLNRHGYGGVCRYNQKGQYNVPYGKYKKPYFPEIEILSFAEKAKRATFICGDFRKTLEMVGHGDVVYCDPPYLPISKTADFSNYHTGGFSHNDHVDLAIDLMNISEHCAPVVISNCDTESARNLYYSFSIQSVTAPRAVGNRTGGEAKASELIASRSPLVQDVNIGWMQRL
ncbi:TPA: Dam family site-specific DNA-(adenine-N6)-methyltransferase [Serratia fonticola]